jgi:hypothetical protein
MTREQQKSIKLRKQESQLLVRYANPKSSNKPQIEIVTEILQCHIPYCAERPIITRFTVTEFHRNSIIRVARYKVDTLSGQSWEISAYEDLKGRTPEQKEEDKNATFPSGLFKIFHSLIKRDA